MNDTVPAMTLQPGQGFTLASGAQHVAAEVYVLSHRVNILTNVGIRVTLFRNARVTVA